MLLRAGRAVQENLAERVKFGQFRAGPFRDTGVRLVSAVLAERGQLSEGICASHAAIGRDLAMFTKRFRIGQFDREHSAGRGAASRGGEFRRAIRIETARTRTR